jgi:hypothetical protein
VTKNIRSRTVFLTGAAVLSLVIAFGVFDAFSKGANDFSVFYEAWRLVLIGRGAEIYKVSPDRFLYGPGFAWCLAPFAALSKNTALAIWCAAKIMAVGFIAAEFSKRLKHVDSILSLGLSFWGVAFVARPLLIDFSYGQVNLFIVAASVWALLGRNTLKPSPYEDVACWGVLTWIALSKLFPVPLLVIPWLVTRDIRQDRIKNERLGVFLGFVIVLLPPLFSLGWGGFWELLLGWKDALISRGLPLESHNQSFTAFLYHYLSGHPTQILSEGATPLFLGWASLSTSQIGLLSLFWTTLTLGFALGWIFSGSKHEAIKWSAVTIGLLIVPSHLIWKPYFVMSVPLAIIFIHQVYKKTNWTSYLAAIGIFMGINLMGFDFVGHNWAAHIEASSVLLFMHVILIFLVASNWCSMLNRAKQ